MAALAKDLRHLLAHEPVSARPPSLLRRAGLWSKRNPAAFVGTTCALLCLMGFIAALVYGFIHTRQALEQTRHAQAKTLEALQQVEAEAGQAALSLVTTLMPGERPSFDARVSEIRRGIATLESLAARFPENPDIQQALEQLHYALKVHARLKARRETAAESSDGRRPGSPHFK